MISVSFGPLAQSVEQKAFNLCVIGSIPIRPTILSALVAQLDRVLGFEPRCRGFESLRVRHVISRNFTVCERLFLKRVG